MERIAELREKQQKLVAEAREAYDQIDAEGVDEARAKELEEQHDRAMKEFDALEKRIAKLERLEAAESHLDEPERDARDFKPRNREAKPEDDVRHVEDMKPEERESFQRDILFRHLRFGPDADFSQEEKRILREMRAQATQDASPGGGAGGFTIPTGFQAEIYSSLKQFGPMNDGDLVRRIETDMGNDLHWPKEDNTSQKGAILAENAKDSEQDLVFQEMVLSAFKYTTKIIRVSEELLQDSAFDMGAFIQGKFGERIGRILNEHFTTGTGSGQPNGIVTASGAGVTASGNSTIDFDDVIDLYHSVDPAYRTSPRARFMFNDATLKVLRKLKDNDGNYIWQPANAAGNVPATILGAAYSINQDMADIGPLSKPMVYGDFNAYVVRNVRGLTVKRLVERYADFHQVGFIGFGRWDADLLDSAAVKHVVMESA